MVDCGRPEAPELAHLDTCDLTSKHHRPQKNCGEAAPDRRQLSNERIVAALRLRILEELNRALQQDSKSSTADLLARLRKHVVYMTTTCRTAQTKKNRLTAIDNSTNCHSRAWASSMSTMRAGKENSSANCVARKRLAPATIFEAAGVGPNGDGLNQTMLADGCGKLLQLVRLEGDRKSTRLNLQSTPISRMPSSA